MLSWSVEVEVKLNLAGAQNNIREFHCNWSNLHDFGTTAKKIKVYESWQIMQGLVKVAFISLIARSQVTQGNNRLIQR